jgi:hypothetical protein
MIYAYDSCKNLRFNNAIRYFWNNGHIPCILSAQNTDRDMMPMPCLFGKEMAKAGINHGE